MNDPETLLDAYEVPIHPSVLRPVLWMGAERRFVILDILGCFLLVVFTGYDLVAMLLIALLGLGVHGLAIELAKQDPQLAEIFLRSLRYQDYYPAQAARLAPPPSVSS